MKAKMKRFLSLMLAIVLVFGMVPMDTYAASGAELISTTTEDETDGDVGTPTCVNAEGCTDGKHDATCELYEGPTCAKAEGCTEDKHDATCELYEGPTCAKAEGCTEDKHDATCELYEGPTCAQAEGCTDGKHDATCELYEGPTCAQAEGCTDGKHDATCELYEGPTCGGYEDCVDGKHNSECALYVKPEEKDQNSIKFTSPKTTRAANVAKVGNTEYATIDEAIAAWTNGTTLTLLADVTLSDVIKLNSNEYHILDLGKYTMTAAKNKDAIQYVVKGRSSAGYALDIMADENNPGGITATGKSVVIHTKPLTSAPSKDRPITRFYGGVFNASYIVKQGGNLGAGYTGASAPYIYFYDGEYNGTIYTNRSQVQFHGGVFNGNIQMSVDSSAYGLVAGGTFKNLSNSMGSELNSDKFTIGSEKGVYDKEVYIDDNGNYVIAAAEPSEGIEAAVAKTPGTNDYLAYSKVATEGQLNYTDVKFALKNNTSATVTVYVDEIDMSGINFNGTIVVPEESAITIKNAPENLKVVDTEGATLTPNADGSYTTKPMAAEVNGVKYETFQAAVAAAEADDTVTVLENLKDIAITVDKNLTIKGATTLARTATPAVTAENVTINAVEDCGELKVENLSFTGNSWINSGAASKLTVSGVTADVTPLNAAQTNSRSAFISLGKSEQHKLELVVENCNIVSKGGSDCILGWAAIKNATLTGNTFGSADAHQSNSDSVKFMSIANGAVFNITGNTVYSDYNGIVFAQNTTRENAYKANIDANTFVGSADHVWIEISGGDTVHATINATSDNTVNGNTFTASDIKAYEKVIKKWTSYAGVDVKTDEKGYVIGGTLAYYAEDVLAEGFEINENKEVVKKTVVAKIGEAKYETLEAAFAAAAEGETITLLADATPTLTSQRAITKASVIDLGGKTLTLIEDDLYFGTTTFKNGTIVVDPSVKPSTAVFWMFANQTLTFDNVKLVATGVTGTYLIGLDGNNSDLNLLNGSEIIVNNETALDLDIICVNASTGNDIVIENSKVNVTNLDGRVFFRGNYTVKGTSDIDLSGITKAGFRIEAGQTLSIEDTATVDIVGEPRDGGIHLTDATATYTKADTATVNATVNKPAVAQIGEEKYGTLEEAFAAANAGDEIVLLSDVAEDVTLPASIIFNGNGKTVGVITAAGEITFKGHTKATNFSMKYTNTTVNIIKGACLELTGTGRMVIGHGATFNITGTITDAKTADKATLTPSLIMPGASFTGAGVTFNVKNAYIKAPSSYCSSSSSASGTFDFNIENSIIETAGKLAFESQSVAATVNFELKNSVLTTGSHLVFGVSRGEVVIDNSNVNVGTSKQIENQSTMTIKNGSVVNGLVATSANAKNPGTIIVENATYAVTGEFSGSDLDEGTIIVKKGATVSAGSITKANIKIDATGMSAGDEVNLTANLSNLAGKISVINNDKLEANIVDGKIVLAIKPVAKVGDVGYASLEEAFAAAKAGETVTILAGNYTQNLDVNKAITVVGETDAEGKNLVNFTGKLNITADGATVKNLNFNNGGSSAGYINAKDVLVEGCTVVGGNGFRSCYTSGKVTFKDSTITGSTYGIHFDGNAGGEIVIDNCVITGWTSFAKTIKKVAMKDTTFAEGNYNYIRFYQDAEISGCKFNEKMDVDVADGVEATVTVTNSTVVNGNVEDLFEGADIANSTITVDGKELVRAAKIGDAYYETIAEAMKAAQEGETVTILAGNYTQNLDVNKATTVVGETDADGKNLVNFTGKLNITANGATVKNLNFNNGSSSAGYISAKDVLVEGCTVVGGNGFRSCYTSGTVTFKDSTITGSTYGIHFDGNAGGNIVINNCVITGWTSFAKTIKKVAMTNTTFKEGNYNYIRFYQEEVVIDGCTFNKNMGIDLYVENAKATVTNSTVTNGNVEDLFEGADIVNSTITVDGKELVRAAKVGNVYYETLEEALKALTANATLTLLGDVTISENWDARSTGGKITVPVTIDGNGHTLKFTNTVDDRNYFAVLRFEADAKVENLTFDLSEAVGTGNRFRAISAKSNLTVDNCTFIGNPAVTNTRAIIFGEGAGPEISNVEISVTNSTFKNWRRGLTDNENAKDVKSVTTTGNTFTNANVYVSAAENITFTENTMKNAWVNVKSYSAENKLNVTATGNTLEANGTNYNYIEAATVTAQDEFLTPVAEANGKKYPTLQAAIKAGGTVKLLADVVLAESVEVVGTVVLDLNGKTITGTDNSTGSFGLINIQPSANLTINDSVGTGKITLTATNNRGWGGYSSVISNQRGKLTVNSGKIEHLGGTDMAYGIDNLTNGKGTYAETVINGGTIKSTYRAIRQFLNGEDAQNILTVNGGTIKGTNKSIWMQDPSKNANSGKLTVGENAKLVGDVYLSVTEGSTTWPVTVSISSDALVGKVATANIPDGYVIKLVDGVYGVKEKTELNGEGTEANPYLIESVKDLILFRDSVNAGETKYNEPGKYVALAADIDLAGVDWSVNIGDDCNATFDGIFDGKGHIISNLASTETAAKADQYICTGLFGAIYGSAVVKNLTIENVNINTAVDGYVGNNVAAVVGLAYNCTGSIENVKVTGDIVINAENATGVGTILGYDYYGKVTVKDCAVKGNDGSYIKGASYAGGIVGYGSNNITVTDCVVNNIAVTAQCAVGAIAGITLANSTVENSEVADVALTVTHENWQNSAAIAVGTITSSVNVSNINYSDVTVNGVETSTIVGSKSAEHPTKPVEKVEALAGNVYYATFEEALEKGVGDTVAVLNTIVINADETVTLDLKGKTVIGTPTEAKAYAVIENRGDLTITGGGAIVCDHKLAGSTGYAVNTITNCGTLTIDGVTVENKSTASNQIGYAIDNNSTSGNAVVLIKDGEVKASGSNYYDGIRQFCNSTTSENSVTVEGGTVSSIWLQNPSDGSTGKNTNDVKGSVTISGGNVGGLWLEPSTEFTAAITGGHIAEVGYFQPSEGRDIEGFISGGTFGKRVEEKWCAAGYEPVDNGDGTYGVQLETAKVAMVGDVKYETVAEAVEACLDNDKEDTIVVIADSENEKAIYLDTGDTLDLAGYKVEAKRIFGWNDSNVKDSSEEKSGRLKADKVSLAKNNEQLPILTEDGSYVFTTVNYLQTFYPTGEYVFGPRSTEMYNYFADGSIDNQVQFIVKLAWDNSQGEKTYQEFCFPDSMVKTVYGTKVAFSLKINNAELLENLTYSTLIRTQANTEGTSTPISQN